MVLITPQVPALTSRQSLEQKYWKQKVVAGIKGKKKDLAVNQT